MGNLNSGRSYLITAVLFHWLKESLMGDAIETGSRRNGEKRVVGFL